MKITPTSSLVVFQRQALNQTTATDTSGSSKTTSVQTDLSPQARLETIAQIAINRAVSNRRQQVAAMAIDMRQGASNFTSESLAASLLMQQNSGGN